MSVRTDRPTNAEANAAVQGTRHPRVIDGPGQVPTPDQAAYAAAELRAVLKMLGPGPVTFFRDCSSIERDRPSRDAIRERIALLDVYAGQVAPVVPDGSDEVPDAVQFCDKGPCSDRLNHDGKCS